MKKIKNYRREIISADRVCLTLIDTSGKLLDNTFKLTSGVCLVFHGSVPFILPPHVVKADCP
jgi:hypothetical protein